MEGGGREVRGGGREKGGGEEVERQRELKLELKNLIFYKDCSLGSVKKLSNN